MSKSMARPEVPPLALNAYFASLVRRHGLTMDQCKKAAAAKRESMGNARPRSV